MAYRASYGSEEIGQERIVIMEKLSKTVSFVRVVREGDCSVFVFNAQLTDAVIQWRHAWTEWALCVALAIPAVQIYIDLTSIILTSIYMDKEGQFT